MTPWAAVDIEPYVPWLVPVLLVLHFCFVSFLAAQLTGWRRLARQFRYQPSTDLPLEGGRARRKDPEGTRFRFQSCMFGWAGYNHCLTVITNAEGLYFRLSRVFPLPFHPPIFIPWAEMKNVQHEKLLWNEVVRFDAGQPRPIRLRFLRKFFVDNPSFQPAEASGSLGTAPARA